MQSLSDVWVRLIQTFGASPVQLTDKVRGDLHVMSYNIALLLNESLGIGQPRNVVLPLAHHRYFLEMTHLLLLVLCERDDEVCYVISSHSSFR